MSLEQSLTYVLRIFIAIVLGIAVGFERKIRAKEAGIRTHAIVAFGGCLFMIISKYGFGDITGNYDASRIASQVVSGIGFIGAGMILYKKQVVNNLTTAAGIWATAGIGMATGCGMYWFSLGATLLIILTQCFLHVPLKILKSRKYYNYKIVFRNAQNDADYIQKTFGVELFTKISADRTDGGVNYTVSLSTDKIFTVERIDALLAENKEIKSIERIDDN